MARKSHPVFAAFFARLAPVMERGPVGRARRELLAPLSGRVLELGAGTGENFKHYPPTVSSVAAIEPDPHMSRRAKEAAERAPVPVELIESTAEALPFADDSFDAVVATLVLCSVDDLERSIAEVGRVLAPNGSLVFFEHVRSGNSPRLAAWQDRLERPWGYFGAGCHPNRDTAGALRAAGFEFDQLDEFDLGGTPPIVRPHISGEAHLTG